MVIEGHNFPFLAQYSAKATDPIVNPMPNNITGQLLTSKFPLNTGTTREARNTAEKLIQIEDNALISERLNFFIIRS